MISIKELAAKLQDKLNGDFDTTKNEYVNLHTYGLDRFTPGTRYEFRIMSDEMEYLRSEMRGASSLPGEPTNTMTVYICGLLHALPGASIEGTEPEYYNTMISSTLDILVPECEEAKIVTVQDENGTSTEQEVRLGDIVQMLIEHILSSTDSEYVKGQDKTIYYIGTAYSRPIPGIKAIRGSVGVSLPITVYINYSVVATGISSEDIGLTINGTKIVTTRIGIARTTVSEGNISSASGNNGISKARPNATQLTISFDSPYRAGVIGKLQAMYLLEGAVAPMTVQLTIPVEVEDGVFETMSGTYRMIFADNGLNGELNLAASISCRLVEFLEN